MDKVDHLRKRVEPFAVLFWALVSTMYVLAQHLTLPTDPA